MDLDKLYKTYKDARLKYLNVRRDAEETLIAALVDEVKALRDAEEKRKRGGRPPKEEAA